MSSPVPFRAGFSISDSFVTGNCFSTGAGALTCLGAFHFESICLTGLLAAGFSWYESTVKMAKRNITPIIIHANCLLPSSNADGGDGGAIGAVEFCVIEFVDICVLKGITPAYWGCIIDRTPLFLSARGVRI